MRARRPTSAMPRSFLCCERAFCCSMVVMWPVLMQCWLMWCAPMWFDAVWLLVLCHVTWCNAMSCDVRSRVELSSVVPCNGMEPKMPLVLRSHCVFEVVIQSTILYYKALLCTAKYYSSTTLYYTVLQRATPVLHCTTKRHSWLMSVAYETPFTMRGAQESQSIFTKYCTCHAKWMPSVIRVTYETSFPMRGASKVTLQTHQLLRLPRKMNLMIDPRRIWNVI